jgi:very-short-patch-repair endonuclease
VSTREVIAQARRFGGVITTKEVLDLGMARSTLKRRVDDGVFVRIGRGILALPGTSTRPDVLMRAAGRLLGAVVSHQTAARMHRMAPIHKTSPTITVPHRGTYVFPGLVVHQSTDLLPSHIMRIGPHRVTTPERTIVDLAKVMKPTRLERVVDNALAAGIADFEGLAVLCLALSRQGKKGMRALREMVRVRADDKRVTETVLERRLSDLLAKEGLPTPVRQFHAPWLEPIDGRVDFAYIDEKIVIEADSRRWHGLFAAFETDRRRDMAAQLAGWIVLRFTWAMITEEPGFVAETVGDAVTSRSGGG